MKVKKVTIHCPKHGKTECVDIWKGIMCQKCYNKAHAIQRTKGKTLENI